MTINLGNTILVAGQTRNSNGSPVGPANFQLSDSPGIVTRDFIGADREEPEHVMPDHGSITFQATRIFGSVADAIAYCTTTIFTEDVAGQLKFDNTQVFGARSAITNRRVSQIGVAVAIQYTIEG